MTLVAPNDLERAPGSAPPRDGVRGRLEATFAVRSPLPEGQGSPPFAPGVVARVSTSTPLELRRPIASRDLFFLRNVTAGVLGGDSYEVSLTCEAGANVRVQPTSATKVYATGGLEAVSRVSLRAESGACLVWGPNTTILHAGSRFRSEVEVTSAGGVVLIAETLIMGRLAAGEAFAFDSYASSLEVKDKAGLVLFAERTSLSPRASIREAMGGLGALTTVYAIRLKEDQQTAERMNKAKRGCEFAGWSSLPNGAGIVAKALVGSASNGEVFAGACMEALLAPFLELNRQRNHPPT